MLLSSFSTEVGKQSHLCGTPEGLWRGPPQSPETGIQSAGSRKMGFECVLFSGGIGKRRLFILLYFMLIFIGLEIIPMMLRTVFVVRFIIFL